MGSALRAGLVAGAAVLVVALGAAEVERAVLESAVVSAELGAPAAQVIEPRGRLCPRDISGRGNSCNLRDDSPMHLRSQCGAN